MLDAACHMRAARALDRLARDLALQPVGLTGDAWDTADERRRFLVVGPGLGRT
ncbi:hypothetical protein [Streptomyces sp. KN37]|uniref:hypothetical protein n=1 Tax=Streptomyces sp. KN37 TaxID=3090667 RepID=UPI002A74D152|nr:hypothetical protein [Streptomyces sp. KN37]WPO75144.1 hypothetical protein R9806_33330 [Streptomyces sp. KN37]